jgi:hypothetical protein
MEPRSLSWWSWLVTVPMLAWGVAGHDAGIAGASALTVAQCVRFALREDGVRSFPFQVRAAYLGLLLLGRWPPLAFLHWIQLTGTTAMVMVGYCPLARVLSLLPWNRRGPLTLRLVRAALLSPPVRGTIVEALRRAG